MGPTSDCAPAKAWLYAIWRKIRCHLLISSPETAWTLPAPACVRKPPTRSLEVVTARRDRINVKLMPALGIFRVAFLHSPNAFHSTQLALYSSLPISHLASELISSRHFIRCLYHSVFPRRCPISETSFASSLPVLIVLDTCGIRTVAAPMNTVTRNRTTLPASRLCLMVFSALLAAHHASTCSRLALWTRLDYTSR